jgi:hypothetical protein
MTTHSESNIGSKSISTDSSEIGAIMDAGTAIWGSPASILYLEMLLQHWRAHEVVTSPVLRLVEYDDEERL